MKFFFFFFADDEEKLEDLDFFNSFTPNVIRSTIELNTIDPVFIFNLESV